MGRYSLPFLIRPVSVLAALRLLRGSTWGRGKRQSSQCSAFARICELLWDIVRDTEIYACFCAYAASYEFSMVQNKHFQELLLLQRVMLSSGALVVSVRESGFGECCGELSLAPLSLI